MSPDVLALALVAAVAAGFAGLFGWMGFSLLRFRAYYRHKGEPAPEMPLGALVRYVLREGFAMLTLGWWQLRAARRDGLLPAEGPETGPPVLCVHGITQAGSNLWGIRRALARRGRDSLAVSLGRFRLHLTEHVTPLLAALRVLIAR
ncbi:MAG: hypothetical protein ACK4YP_23835, partial [Myxococcota bacterium]